MKLLVLDVNTRQTDVLAELTGTNLGHRPPRVTWSPDGGRLTFGPLLLEADGGRVISQDMPPRVLWSLDGAYVLGAQPRYREWGALSLTRAATGEQQELGYGSALGWTPAGEAVVVRWEDSRYFPAPTRKCW